MAEMIKCKINGKFDIILPKHRADRPEWYTEDGWEKKRLEHMHKKISEQDSPVIYYIGTEEGDMAGLCALWGGDMVLFEPNDKVWTNIKAIWEANRLPAPIFLTAFAANETYGEVAICSLGDITGEVIHDHGFKELCDPGDIPRVKIDDMVSRAEGKVPDFISLDVEGSEWEVLRGAEQTLKTHRPGIYLSLHPEFIHEQYNEWGAELRAWLIGIGYKETLIDYPFHEVHLYYEATDE